MSGFCTGNFAWWTTSERTKEKIPNRRTSNGSWHHLSHTPSTPVGFPIATAKCAATRVASRCARVSVLPLASRASLSRKGLTFLESSIGNVIARWCESINTTISTTLVTGG